MPISNGIYTAPTWANGGSPAIDAAELQAMSDTLEDLSSGFGWNEVAIVPLDTTTYTSSAPVQTVGGVNYADFALPSTIDLTNANYEMELILYGFVPYGASAPSTATNYFACTLVSADENTTTSANLYARATESSSASTYAAHISYVYPQTSRVRTGAVLSNNKRCFSAERYSGWLNGTNQFPTPSWSALGTETNFTQGEYTTLRVITHAAYNSGVYLETFGAYFRYRRVS